MRSVPHGASEFGPTAKKLPFTLSGTPNIFLETVKRGEDDNFEKPGDAMSVILRLYEAFGGHGHTQLKIAPHLRVLEAYTTNLLEDQKDELQLTRDAEGDMVSRLELDFRGFEVKTVKLLLACGGQFELGARRSR